MKRAVVFVCALAMVVVGCGSDDPEMPTQTRFGGDRPVYLEVPTTYDHGEAAPLLIVLHGFGANGLLQLRYTELDKLVEEEGVLLAAPEGTVDADNKQFWNATDWCCDNYGSGVDDVAYIKGLIDDMSAVWNVDPNRVYLFGHSNGGFMSYRMACDHADTIAAVVSLAGGTYLDAGKCSPSEPVSALQIHGDNDETVLYEGEDNQYPSAGRTAEIWAGYNGCAATRTKGSAKLDLEDTLAGGDTVVEAHDGCAAGVNVDLWTIENGGHIPAVTEDFRAQVWAWLTAHAKR